MGVDKRTKNGDVIYDVAIIGGGASGLAAAITAARAGARCCIVEADVEAGLGILATGNGRCNISNARLAPRHFLHEDAARAMFGAHAERDIADFFERLGLMLAEEGEGRLYPVTRRAESVRDVLLNACSRLGVDILTCATVSHAAPCTSPSGYWDLTLSVPAAALSFKQGRDAKARVRNARKALAVAERTERTLHARRVIIAVGGRSASTCEVFRLAHLNEIPVLCPIACEIDSNAPGATRHALALEHLDGLRVEGALSLMREVGYEFAYMFKYSERPGTFAHEHLPDDVPDEVKSRRLSEIIALQNELGHASNLRDVGREFEVLVEGRSKRDEKQLSGRTSQNKVVVFDRGRHDVGDYVRVRITGCTPATLFGEEII